MNSRTNSHGGGNIPPSPTISTVHKSNAWSPCTGEETSHCTNHDDDDQNKYLEEFFDSIVEDLLFEIGIDVSRLDFSTFL